MNSTKTTKRSFGRFSCGVALSVLSLACGQAMAQQYAPAPGTGISDQGSSGQATGAAQAAGIRMEPFVIYPSVGLAVGHNDNVTFQQNNKISSVVTVLSPALLAELKGSQTAFRLGYLGNYGWFENSSTDNYNHHEIRGGADFDFSARANLKLMADYLMKSDPRGFTLASTTVASPNRYHQTDFGGVFSYGAAGAQGRIEVEAMLTDKQYQNNRAVTESLDFDSQRYGGTFFWRVGPKTEWLFQGVHTRTDYTAATALQDNNENKFLTGLKWEATALTTGFAKFGYSERTYSNSGAAQKKAKGGVWEVAVRWSPLTYSVVDVATGRRFADSQAGPLSTYAKIEYLTVAWTHGWSERVKSTLSGAYERDNYAGISREDKVGYISAKISYDMRRWLSLGAEYKFSERDSTAAGSNYKQNLILFSARASL